MKHNHIPKNRKAVASMSIRTGQWLMVTKYESILYVEPSLPGVGFERIIGMAINDADKGEIVNMWRYNLP